MARPSAAISWSGGKDSCAAFHRARAEFDFVAAITLGRGNDFLAPTIARVSCIGWKTMLDHMKISFVQ